MKVPGYLEGRFRPRLGEVNSQNADREAIGVFFDQIVLYPGIYKLAMLWTRKQLFLERIREPNVGERRSVPLY
jgi:hypothetical protein